MPTRPAESTAHQWNWRPQQGCTKGLDSVTGPSLRRRTRTSAAVGGGELWCDGAVSRAVEETNRRMLRARDAMDRAYAQPLDVPALARIAHVSEAHFTRTFLARAGCGELLITLTDSGA